MTLLRLLRTFSVLFMTLDMSSSYSGVTGDGEFLLDIVTQSLGGDLLVWRGGSSLTIMFNFNPMFREAAFEFHSET